MIFFNSHSSCLFCFDCIAQKSLQNLFHRRFKSEIINIFSSRLVGPDNSTKMFMLSSSIQESPKFDAGIHLRNQFSYFENEQNPSQHLKEIQLYIQSEYTQKLFQNIVMKLKKSIPLRGSVYVSSDNEQVKRVLCNKLQYLGYNVYRIRSDEGIYHSKDSARISNIKNKMEYFDLAIDWRGLVLSNILMTWRDVKPGNAYRFISTFAKSARLASRSKGLVLIDPNHLDTSDNNWKSF